jgi:integrase
MRPNQSITATVPNDPNNTPIPQVAGDWTMTVPTTRVTGLNHLVGFPSERGTPMSKHNVWRRNMEPKLKKVGLKWANFLVMRRTFVTLNKASGADAKTVADQCGHDVGVSLRDYAQTPIDVKRALVNKLEKLVLGKPKP